MKEMSKARILDKKKCEFRNERKKNISTHKASIHSKHAIRVSRPRKPIPSNGFDARR
jgi:hypothetical protein